MRFRRRPTVLAVPTLLVALATMMPTADAETGEPTGPATDAETITRVGSDAFVATRATGPDQPLGPVADPRAAGLDLAATSGFALIPSVQRYAFGEYTIRLVDSPGIERHRRAAEAAAAVIASETGLTVSVAPGKVADRIDQDGEVLVRVAASSPCGPLGANVVGCGGPSQFLGAILSGEVSLAPQLACEGNSGSVVAHELGHAFGLAHTTERVDDLLQVMYPNTSSKAPSFRAGDRAGLRAIAGRFPLTDASADALTDAHDHADAARSVVPAIGRPAAEEPGPDPSHPVGGTATVGSLFSQPAVTRVLDTRLGTGLAGAFAPGESRTLSLASALGAAPADAVVLNLTVTETNGSGYVTAWPTGAARPETSSANYVAGTDAANLVIVKLGPGNSVDLANEGGSTHLVADLLGVFSTTGASAFVPSDPVRILDTRESTVPNEVGFPLGCEDWATVQAARLTAAGVPLSTAVAEVVNLTAADANAAGFVSFRARTDIPRPGVLAPTSNLNLASGDTRANLAITPGREWLVQASADLASHVIVDLAGWFVPPATTSATRLVALDPVRVLDTRRGVGSAGRFAPGVSRRLTLPAAGGVVPDQIAAVVMNVTVVGPDAPGFLTAWPGASVLPDASNVNYDRDEVVPNLVIVKVGAGATIDLLASAGSPDVVADVMGYFVRP